MPDKIKILYVDDEPNNLVGFKAAFRISYSIFTAASAAEAVTCLEANPDIRIIFCDQRMPVKTGVEFFAEIRNRFPLPVRILITAYTDIESVINAINRGNIFRYVKKPWTDADIISSVGEANSFYLANSMLTIKNQELQTAYDELDKFAYSVSHDLRGPLSGILGAIKVAQDMGDVQEMQYLLAMMEKSVKKLDTYIISMHDYYSLQRGELKITEIDLNGLAYELKDIYRVLANTNDIVFDATVKQSEPFRSDPSTLRLILNNLLSNAFKYQNKNSDRKAVNLKMEVVHGTATITISDTGVGIAAEYFEEMFHLFSRAISQEAGSGFGLYNVKGALHKLNGTIEVDSEINKGTVFTVVIPGK
jgi:two-component system sensor histidine kinase/response regulator